MKEKNLAPCADCGRSFPEAEMVPPGLWLPRKEGLLCEQCFVAALGKSMIRRVRIRLS